MGSSSATASLTHGLSLLRSVVDGELTGQTSHGVVKLSEQTGLDRGRASRILAELCLLGLLQRAEDGRSFRAGHQFFAFADAADPGWVRQSRAVLRELVAQHHHSAFLSTAIGVRVLTLRHESPAFAAEIGMEAGRVIPIWCTGAGRALLLDHEPEELESLLSEVEMVGVGGPFAAHSVGEVVQRVSRDRDARVVVAEGEFAHEIIEVAAPVRDGEGQILSAISIAGLRSGAAGQLPELMSSVRSAAEQLSDLIRTVD